MSCMEIEGESPTIFPLHSLKQGLCFSADQPRLCLEPNSAVFEKFLWEVMERRDLPI